MAAANTGSSSSSSRPMPDHWAPWPENTQTGARDGPDASPVTTAGWVSPSANARRPAVSSSLSAATTTPRPARCARRRARVCPMSASSCAREAVGEPRGLRGEAGLVGGGDGVEGDARASREPRPSPGRARGRVRRGVRLLSGVHRCLLQDGVRDRAAVAVTGHTRQPRTVHRRPRCRLGDQAQTRLGPRDVLARPVDGQGRRDDAVLHGERGLDETRDAGGRLAVTDVGLHRSDQAGALPGGTVAHDLGERGGLDRVADLGAGAVRLDVVDLAGCDAGRRVRPAQQMRLSGRAGRHDPVGAAVLVHGAAADERDDAVAVAPGVGEALEDDDAAALAAAVAVRGLVERLGAAVRGDRPGDVEDGRQAGARHQHDAAGERHGHLAAAQTGARLVECDQRGGAGGVHGDARAAQVEGVRDPVGHAAQRGPDTGPRLDARQVLQEAAAVVVGADADEDAGVAAREARRGDAGVLQRLPGHLQRHALLRVELACLGGGHAEEGGVEAADVVDEGAVGDHPRQDGGVLPGLGALRRPPVLGYRSGRVARVHQQLPERLRGVDATGEAAADADDGDPVLGARRQGGHLTHHGSPLTGRASSAVDDGRTGEGRPGPAGCGRAVGCAQLGAAHAYMTALSQSSPSPNR